MRFNWCDRKKQRIADAVCKSGKCRHKRCPHWGKPETEDSKDQEEESMKIDRTLEACVEHCSELLSEHRAEIEEALVKCDGRLTINLAFAIEPQGGRQNDLTSKISFIKEKCRDERKQRVEELQMSIEFPTTSGEA